MKIAIHHAAANFPHFRIGLNYINHTPFGIHQIEVQLLCQPLKQRYAFDKKWNAFIAQVIGTDGYCVAGYIAASKPSFFQNSNIVNAMVFGKVMGVRKPMSARANNQTSYFLASGGFCQ